MHLTPGMNLSLFTILFTAVHIMYTGHYVDLSREYFSNIIYHSSSKLENDNF